MNDIKDLIKSAKEIENQSGGCIGVECGKCFYTDNKDTCLSIDKLPFDEPNPDALTAARKFLADNPLYKPRFSEGDQVKFIKPITKRMCRRYGLYAGNVPNFENSHIGAYFDVLKIHTSGGFIKCEVETIRGARFLIPEPCLKLADPHEVFPPEDQPEQPPTIPATLTNYALDNGLSYKTTIQLALIICALGEEPPDYEKVIDLLRGE